MIWPGAAGRGRVQRLSLPAAGISRNIADRVNQATSSRPSRKWQSGHSLSRTLAATLGSIPLALASGVAVTLALPLTENVRLLLGSYSVFPAWVGVSCWIFLAPSGRRAWLNVAVGMVVAALVVLAALALGRGTGRFGTFA